MNVSLTQVRQSGRLKFPGKIIQGVLIKSVPQTDTGMLVEYTKANG